MPQRFYQTANAADIGDPVDAVLITPWSYADFQNILGTLFRIVNAYNYDSPYITAQDLADLASVAQGAYRLMNSTPISFVPQTTQTTTDPTYVTIVEDNTIVGQFDVTIYQQIDSDTAQANPKTIHLGSVNIFTSSTGESYGEFFTESETTTDITYGLNIYLVSSTGGGGFAYTDIPLGTINLPDATPESLVWDLTTSPATLKLQRSNWQAPISVVNSFDPSLSGVSLELDGAEIKLKQPYSTIQKPVSVSNISDTGVAHDELILNGTTIELHYPEPNILVPPPPAWTGTVDSACQIASTAIYIIRDAINTFVSNIGAGGSFTTAVATLEGTLSLASGAGAFIGIVYQLAALLYSAIGTSVQPTDAEYNYMVEDFYCEIASGSTAITKTQFDNGRSAVGADSRIRLATRILIDPFLGWANYDGFNTAARLPTSYASYTYTCAACEVTGCSWNFIGSANGWIISDTGTPFATLPVAGEYDPAIGFKSWSSTNHSSMTSGGEYVVVLSPETTCTNHTSVTVDFTITSDIYHHLYIYGLRTDGSTWDAIGPSDGISLGDSTAVSVTQAMDGVHTYKRYFLLMNNYGGNSGVDYKFSIQAVSVS
jgi:hypothetical protein